jgi:Bacterial SH3 domain
MTSDSVKAAAAIVGPQLRAPCIGAAILSAMMVLVAPALAQTTDVFPSTLPNTMIAPAGVAPEPAVLAAPESANVSAAVSGGDEKDELSPAEVPPPPVHRRANHRHVKASRSARGSTGVEPTSASLRLKEDSWAYSQPSKSSKRIERVTAGKFINVTGATRDFLQVRLKRGTTAYVPNSAVRLTRSTDKVFQLTSDTAVLSEPTRYGKKVSEVHKGHSVHVVGVSLNYMKIRMRDGLEGYIPRHALE